MVIVQTLHKQLHLGQVFSSDDHHHASAEFIGEFFNKTNRRIGTT